MKRVLSLSTLYPNAHTPRFGTFVARSLEALAARGDWDVTVINPIGVPPLALGRYRDVAAAAVDGREHGVNVYRPRFTLIPKVGARSNPAAIARTALPIARRLHRERPFDLLDAQFFWPDGPAVARLAGSLGLPFSIKARGSDITFWGGQDYARKAMVQAADEATGLLAVSAALRRDMVALGMPAHRIALHYTGLDRDRFRPLAHQGLRSTLGQRLGLPLREGEPLLATVGALIERKGQDIVIGALAGLPEARLLLVGNGPEESYLKRLASDVGVADRVHFLGSVDHDLLPVILSAADAMVLPSSNEGLANAWVEALACGTPLVIADAGGARELVTSRDAGLIVGRDPESVAAGVRTLLDAPPSPLAVAAMADRFSWEANAAALSDFYDTILAAS